MAIDPLTAGIDLATTAINKIWPDKSAEEAAELAAAVSVVQGQLAANTAAAAQPGVHFRDGAGWVCVVAMGCNFVVRPLLEWGCVLAGHPVSMPQLDSTQTTPMLLSLLGLGGYHVYENVKTAP